MGGEEVSETKTVWVEQDITKFLGAYVSKCGYANAILFGHKFGYLLACKVFYVMKWNTQVHTDCCTVCLCVDAQMEIEFTGASTPTNNKNNNTENQRSR